MGWAIGYDSSWKRDIGYGVPAMCDHPGCGKEIDRGLAHVCCGEQPYGGESGCGLFFCSEHLQWSELTDSLCCERCALGDDPFEPTPDLTRWLRHKLTHESWGPWRDENPEEVRKIRAAIMGTEVYCCIGGSMYTYDEEPDGRHLFVLLEDHQREVEALRAAVRDLAAVVQSDVVDACAHCDMGNGSTGTGEDGRPCSECERARQSVQSAYSVLGEQPAPDPSQRLDLTHPLLVRLGNDSDEPILHHQV